jgi:antitoxin ParD1/3/4
MNKHEKIKETTVSLGPHFADFVGDAVRSGRYRSASDVVQAGLRLLEEEEAKLALLRETIDAGDNSGLAKPFDIKEFLARKRKDFRAKV